MININGTEYGLFWSVGAHLDYDAWVVTHPDAPLSEAVIQQVCFMSKAYNDANDIKGAPLKRADLLRLPSRVFDEIREAVAIQIKIDTEVTVEVKPGKKAAAGR